MTGSLARIAAARRRSAFAFAFALASGEQGLDCSPLAGLRPGRVGTRALAGAHWHKAGPSPGPGAEGFAGLGRLSGCAFFLSPSTWAVGKRAQQSRATKWQSEATFTLYAGSFFARLDALSVEGLARACQGLDWRALALSSAGRRTPRALTRRPWHIGRAFAWAVGKRAPPSRAA